MKKFFIYLSTVLLCSTSNMAAAGCSYMNIRNAGSSVTAGQDEDVYPSFSISCLGSVSFKFEDLSGNNPSNIIEHRIDYQNGYRWDNVYSTTSNGSREINISFFPRRKGNYRYKIENIGKSSIKDWRMEGRMPLFTIPGIR